MPVHRTSYKLYRKDVRPPCRKSSLETWAVASRPHFTLPSKTRLTKRQEKMKRSAHSDSSVLLSYLSDASLVERLSGKLREYQLQQGAMPEMQEDIEAKDEEGSLAAASMLGSHLLGPLFLEYEGTVRQLERELR